VLAGGRDGGRKNKLKEKEIHLILIIIQLFLNVAPFMFHYRDPQLKNNL
jgi:hypothetical protein